MTKLSIIGIIMLLIPCAIILIVGIIQAFKAGTGMGIIALLIILWFAIGLYFITK